MSRESLMKGLFRKVWQKESNNALLWRPTQSHTSGAARREGGEGRYWNQERWL
jgi:hypothetical protein